MTPRELAEARELAARTWQQINAAEHGLDALYLLRRALPVLEAVAHLSVTGDADELQRVMDMGKGMVEPQRVTFVPDPGMSELDPPILLDIQNWKAT